MKTIALYKLTLKNFQGGTFSLNSGGTNVAVYGMNASGKTRLASAFSFLLFGKDSLGRSDFSIKDLNAQGEVAQRGIEHTVEGALSVDEELITLGKVYKEKFVKQRGRAKAIFSGHNTQHYINGVPKSEGEYKAFIAEIAGDESTFRLLTSPTVFSGLPWQKQRTLLLEICGDISDTDVIFSNPKLSSLPAILGKRSLDDHRKIVTARRSEINKEMTTLPIRIDEVHRGLPDVTGIDRGEAEREAQEIETTLNDAKLRLQGVNTGGNIADLSKRLSGLNVDLRKMEDAHRSGSLSTLNRLNQQIPEVESMVNTSHRRITAIDGDLKLGERQLQTVDSQLFELRERWTVVDAETFDQNKMSEKPKCPTCGRELLIEQVQEAQDKVLAAFNLNKADRLGETTRKGKDLKEQRDRLIGEINALKKEREIGSGALPGQEAKLKTLIEDRDTLKRSSEDFTGDTHWVETSEEIENTEILIKEEREGKAQDIEKIKGEIFTLESDLKHEKMKVDLFIRREQGEKRIEELKISEKELSREFEKLESELYLMDQFIKTKVSMLTERINSKFEMVRFKLFENLINGGVNEVCEMTVRGIGFSSGLNNAARVQGGLEIVGILQDFYSLRCPIFIDNRESITEIPKLNCQVISLVVSPDDPILRVEVP